MPAFPFREWLLTLSRCAFLAMLVAGVAAHGGTQSSAQPWLEGSLIATSIVYAVGTLFSTRRLCGGWAIIVGTSLLAFLGWLSACQAVSVFDQDLRLFIPVARSSWWPWGSVDAALSHDTMRRITGMLGVLLIARDMGTHAHWRRTTLAVMAWTGVAAAGFGLVQKLYGDIGNYWGTVGSDRFRDTVFGCFWYHGNAGAFLNLCWPLMAVIAWKESQRKTSASTMPQLRRAAYAMALVLILSAIWINHSRAAQAMFLIQCMAAALVLLTRQSDRVTTIKTGRRIKIIWVATLVGTIAVVAMAFGLEQSLIKWTNFGHGGLASDGRWAVMRTCLKWLDQIPIFGYGPGTFAAVFVVKTTNMPDGPAGYWQFAHDDYLQTLLEWGWLGFSLWLVLGLGILAKIMIASCQAARISTPQRQIRLTAILVGLLSVALHAAFDFPMQIFAIQLYASTLAGIGLGMTAAVPVDTLEEKARQ